LIQYRVFSGIEKKYKKNYLYDGYEYTDLIAVRTGTKEK
jgi:hypothetical protein